MSQAASKPMPRLDAAISACEKVQSDGLNGKFASWSDFATARDAAEMEYRAALTEVSIRTARRFMAERRAAASQRCQECGGALPITHRNDRTGECLCANPTTKD